MSAILTRRALLSGAGAGAGLVLSGCDQVAHQPAVRKILLSGDKVHYRLQRLLTDPAALAPEFTHAQMSPVFRTNGNTNPNTDSYNAHVASNFDDWRLEVGGLVNRPQSLSFSQIVSMPARTQITRHDCVEGWSAIGQWHGPTLGAILKLADVKAAARYVVFTCADMWSGNPYYESIDLVDAFHPQTILAWAMNGHRLSVGHGAPLRLRVERQLGYKQAKYVMCVDAVSTLAGIQGGRGGYWEDNVDYDWYAGI